MSILVVMEQRGGEWNRMSWETLAAAQQMAGELNTTASAAVLGQGVDALGGGTGRQAARKGLCGGARASEGVHAGRLRFGAAPVDRAGRSPTGALPAHLPGARFSAQAGDVAGHGGGQRRGGASRGRRAAGAGAPAVPGQGEFRCALHRRDAPHFASLQAGAYRADQLAAGSAPVEKFAPAIAAAEIRTKPLERFRESARAVDLSAAELIVSVGRGIKEAENIALVQELANALGAELAASRPICDAGWLPMERQVGSSGQTVAPKMYMAIGISGAIQHLVGMKGARTIVAINKDAERAHLRSGRLRHCRRSVPGGTGADRSAVKKAK